MDIVYEDIRQYIIFLKPSYGKRNANRFAEYVIRRVWPQEIFDFKDDVLDQLCSLLVTTRVFSSWQEFTQAHNNFLSRISEVYTYTVYAKLTYQEKSRLDGFVNQTTIVYKDQAHVASTDVRNLYDTQLLLQDIQNNDKKYEKSIVVSVLNFIKEYKDYFANACYLACITLCIYAGTGVLIGLLIMLLLNLVDISVFLYLTRNSNPSPLAHIRFMFAIFGDGSNYPKRDASEDEVDLIVSTTQDFSFSFPPIRIHFDLYHLVAKNRVDYLFLKCLQMLGDQQYLEYMEESKKRWIEEKSSWFKNS